MIKGMKPFSVTVIFCAFGLGVILSVFGYQAFTIYQLRTTVAADHNTITAVVDFLNSQIQASQQAQQTKTSQQTTVASPTATSSKK
jgi:hypothetical protein